MVAGTDPERNLARLRAAPEIAALRGRAPDLEAWLFARIEQLPRAEARRKRDAMLRELGAQLGGSSRRQAMHLAQFLRLFRQGRMPRGPFRDEIAAVFELGVAVPRSERHLLRVLTESH